MGVAVAGLMALRIIPAFEEDKVFTGIVARKGEVTEALPAKGGLRLEVAPGGEPPWRDVALGESIAVSGVCLTVARWDALRLRLGFDAVPETLARTILGALRAGDRVNLERSLAVGDRLGGHFVTGHIDSVGEILERRHEGSQVLFRIGIDPAARLQLIPKGSVAVDGVSLTVIEVNASPASFTFAAIPHTLEVTTLGEKRIGDRVNLEMDAIGKWVLQGLQALFPERPLPL